MEKRSTISKKTLKIILGICIGVTILAVAGLFVYTYLAVRKQQQPVPLQARS